MENTTLEERKRWLHLICEEARKKYRDWENNLILPVYKKRDHSYVNYRAVYATSVGYMVYTQIVEPRLAKQVEDKL